MTIVLTGGGTAGHIMPNISLLPYLKEYFDKIYYTGGENGMEKNIAKKYGIPFFGTETVKFDRSKPLKNFAIPLVLPHAVLQAKKILQDIKPDIIYSKGGYAALPTVTAAGILKIPVVVHESDMTLGVANKVSASFAKKVFLSFENQKYSNDPKYIYTGMPLRDEIFGHDKTAAKKSLGIPDDKPVILITGGSLGAKAVNECVYNALDELTALGYVLHIAGKSGNPDIKADGYKSCEFTDNIGEFFAAADIVVSRAGANTAAELYALNKKIIFIPLPKDASRGDQILNAEYYRAKGAAKILYQEYLNAATLVKMIRESLGEPQKNNPFVSPNKHIAELLHGISKGV
ncbi:MAG: UDP-N-acetylglucosamine--N-acetylmuramyl-(pentapeptide) pyrophosphoryl-undecaprenol N-acetylglucosamine transferase [Clostridiales bacterium]|jgi:UDP-N-acetylglucosamine--N-acetylmuramyl-(pentapeptide) pyrophosphoryl-undecaprenol N-acetylglucosamine transferase|nr:UDP-N-acetylglucosamine--N-acetylmuramyl-(pentapeptide) pyrophosphoryl-undecaprenol N-acetylglucosamine transferase [Clostridiales bacterium]